MGQSAFKKKRGKELTKKMLIEKIEEMTTLMIFMEQTLTEWEVWFRLLKLQKDGNTSEEFANIVLDGPIFEGEMSEKIMESIRQNVPEFEPKTEEEMAEQDRPALFDASGNVIEKSVKQDVDENAKTQEEEQS